MDPAMRYGFAAAGAVLGYWLGSVGGVFWGLVVGAALGFGWGELKRLRFELAELKRELASRPREATPPPARTPVRSEAPLPPPAAEPYEAAITAAPQVRLEK